MKGVNINRMQKKGQVMSQNSSNFEFGDKIMRSKRGQVTIFIIVAIVIVSIVLVFFLWVKPNYIFKSAGNLGFEGCVKDVVEAGIAELGLNAGFVNPGFSHQFNGENFVYLCYTNEYYKTCTIQKALLKQSFEEQLSGYLKDRISLCYSNSLDELKAQGHNVISGELKYEILLEPEAVIVSIDAPTSVGGQTFKTFNVKTPSAIYEMVMLATSIVQSETHYGDFEVTTSMILYPDYVIKKMKQGEGTTLYVIESELYKNKFQFASRSLVFPPGNIITG